MVHDLSGLLVYELDEYFALLLQESLDTLVLMVHDLSGLLVYELAGLLAVRLVELLRGAVLGVRKQAELGIHAEDGHHGVGHLRDLVEVIRGAGGDLAREELLRRAAGEGHRDLVEDRLLRVERHLLGEVLCKAEGPAAP